MDISLPSSVPSSSGSQSQTTLPVSTQMMTLTAPSMLSLIPKASMPGLGGNLDIYDAVGKQSMGLFTGGLEAVELANISLGIDTAKSSTQEVEASSNGVTTPDAPAKHDDTLDKILQADGFTYQANPYEVRKDFFAPPSGSSVDVTA